MPFLNHASAKLMYLIVYLFYNFLKNIRNQSHYSTSDLAKLMYYDSNIFFTISNKKSVSLLYQWIIHALTLERQYHAFMNLITIYIKCLIIRHSIIMFNYHALSMSSRHSLCDTLISSPTWANNFFRSTKNPNSNQ